MGQVFQKVKEPQVEGYLYYNDQRIAVTTLFHQDDLDDIYNGWEHQEDRIQLNLDNEEIEGWNWKGKGWYMDQNEYEVPMPSFVNIPNDLQENEEVTVKFAENNVQQAPDKQDNNIQNVKKDPQKSPIQKKK